MIANDTNDVAERTERTEDEVVHAEPSWATALRTGFLPQFSLEALLAIERGLATDDPRILQGATCSPPPLECVLDWPVEAACLVGYAGWQGSGLETVGEVGEFFARACFNADQRLGEPAGCRFYLNFFDDTPRHEAFALVLPIIRQEIRERQSQ